MEKQINNRIDFFVPLTFKKGKSDDDDKEFDFEGIASYGAIEEADSDGEFLDPNGFDFQTEFMTRGFFNFEHMEDPKYRMVAYPTEAKVENNNFQVKGKFLNNEGGLIVKDLAKSLEGTGRVLGFSIEGEALERDYANPKKVSKALITDIAICARPKNKRSLMSLVKGEAPLSKALEANSDSGDAIIPESLDGQAKDLQSKKKKKKKKKDEEDKDKKDRFLSKAEIFDAIFQKIPDCSVPNAKKLFRFIISKNDTMENSQATNNVTNDTLSKAFSTIERLAGMADALQKADGAKGAMASADKANTGAMITEDLAKLQKMYEAKTDEGEMRKAMDKYSDEEYEKGLDQVRANVEASSKEGGEEDESKTEKSKKKMKKGEENSNQAIVSEIGDLLKKANEKFAELTAMSAPTNAAPKTEEPAADPLTKGEAPKTEPLEEPAKAKDSEENVLMKAINSMKESFTTQLSQMQEQYETRLSKAEEAAEQLAQQANKPKSIVSQGYLEKGNTPGAKKMEGLTQLSATANKEDILKKAESLIDYQSEDFAKGVGEDWRLASDVALFEGTNTISVNLRKALGKEGIQIIG